MTLTISLKTLCSIFLPSFQVIQLILSEELEEMHLLNFSLNYIA